MRMKKIVVVLISFLLLGQVSLYSQDRKKIPSEKPKLIIGIIISQMRYDYIYKYWDKFEDGGFKRLIMNGTFCKNTSFNYLFSEQGTGVASIMTGTTPAFHGIVGSEWYDNLKERTIQSTEDERYNTVGGKYESGRMSPDKLMCTSLGDEIKLSNNFKSKVVSISFNPASAIFAGGHSADAAYWFDNLSGNWISSSYYMDSLPTWVRQFNEKKFADTYLSKEWNTLLPLESYTESLPDDNKYETGIKGQHTFPYMLDDLSALKRKRTNYTILNSTPFGDNLIKDFAISTIMEEKLGEDNYPDLLSITFSATEQIGNAFGPHSIEVEDAYLRLDKALAHFIDFIENQMGKQNVLFFLTAEHGVAYVPEYLNDNHMPAGTFVPHAALVLLRSYLNVIYGEAHWITKYKNQQIYLNRNLIEDSKIPLAEMQDVISKFMLQFAGVANSVTANTLQTTNFSHGVFYKIQNSFNQKRSGDVIINLKAGWVDKGNGSTNHTSSYSYDSRVPLIWYGWKTGRKTIVEPVDIIDIAPTIATFLNIAYPNACSGQPVFELIE